MTSVEPVSTPVSAASEETSGSSPGSSQVPTGNRDSHSKNPCAPSKLGGCNATNYLISTNTLFHTPWWRMYRDIFQGDSDRPQLTHTWACSGEHDESGAGKFWSYAWLVFCTTSFVACTSNLLAIHLISLISICRCWPLCNGAEWYSSPGKHLGQDMKWSSSLTLIKTSAGASSPSWYDGWLVYI